MKTLYILISFLFIISISAHAQFSFGVKAGTNIDYLVPSKDRLQTGTSYSTIESTSGIGWHVGGFGNVSLSKQISFIPELQFTHRKYNGEDGNGDSGKLTSNNIELPLLFSYQPFSFLNIDLGPGFNYSLNSTTRLFGKNSDAGLENFNVCAYSGIRINLTPSVSILARYSYGFSKIAEATFMTFVGNTVIQSDSLYFRNNTLQFGLSYKLSRSLKA